MKENLLTVPGVIKDYQKNYLTGNEYLSLPEINPLNGGIMSVNVIHMGAKGLLEFRGAEGHPLLEPYLAINNYPVGLKNNLTFDYLCHWIPAFHGKGRTWELEGEIVAPPGHKGCLLILSLLNTGSDIIKAELGWKGSWHFFNRIIFNSRPVHGQHHAFYDDWTGSLILEAGSGLPLAALALSPQKGDITFSADKGASQNSLASYKCYTPLVLVPGQKAEAVLFMAVNLEGDGAGTTLVDLKRRGSRDLAKKAKKWLGKRALPTMKPELEKLLNRNLFFNYYYASGRALDSDELVSLTSRSPRYYVSAAFWSRDALLWSFPGILLTDKNTARELLLNLYRHHLPEGGEHAHYINGVILYPGFELDQLAAFPLALKAYLKTTLDYNILSEEAVINGLNLFLLQLKKWHDPQKGLYASFLDPSDDPVTYPFLIYSNILIFSALSWLGELKGKGLWNNNTDLKGLAKKLKRAIREHGIITGPYGKMMAWSVDGRGKCEVYDNPPGSLQLASYYNFCSLRDDFFINTVNWIRSSHNPYFYVDKPFQEAGSRHAENPWPMAAANDLFALRRGNVDFFAQASMDNGFMCESINPETGKAATGLAFASAAGFLAAALWNCFGKPSQPYQVR